VAFEKLKIKLKAMSINKSNHGKQIKIQIWNWMTMDNNRLQMG
jgi:hypothetical protein